MKLTPRQAARFWKAFGLAWHVYCQGTGESQGDAAKANAKRHEWMNECGFASMKEIDKTHGFDRVMLLLAQIANDTHAINYFAPAVERRMRFLIRDRLDTLSKITGTAHDWRYARGTMDHMHLAESLDDVPAEQLFKVFEALDTHRRRIAKRGHEKPHAPESHGHAEAA